jgi:polyisoprenyl-teichoic acid--peptidoglycan teichoic acid transferase
MLVPYDRSAVPTFLSIRSFLARYLIALLVGFLLLSAGLWGEDQYAQQKLDQMRSHTFSKGVLKDSGADDSDAVPANFLIVGSDSRKFVTTDEDKLHFGDDVTQSGTRSDTIMIAHIDPNSKQAFLVSFPRDTGVTIPGGCTEKINAAFNSDYNCRGQYGGPDLLVRTIKENFDVDINHYLEVDFVGFRQVIDVLGSVELYFPANARDKKTGLNVSGGCQKLDGLMALNYARSRYYEYFDYAQNRWRQDPTSDFGRIRRQQYLIRTLLQSGVDRGGSNPLTAYRLVDKLTNFVGRDAGFNKDDVRRLVRTFNVTDPGSVPMETLPVTGGRSGRLQLKQPDADAMLLRLRRFAPAPPKVTTTTAAIKTTDVQVLIRNGSASATAAATANKRLRSLGFQTTDPESVTNVASTEIHFTRAGAGKAFLLAKYLGGVGKLVEEATLPAGDVVVVIGADWRGVSDPATTTTTRPRTTTTTPTVDVVKPNPGTPPADSDPNTVGNQFIGCER